MKQARSTLTSVSSRGSQTPRDLTMKFGASAREQRSTTELRGTTAGCSQIDQLLRGPSVAAATSRMTAMIA